VRLPSSGSSSSMSTVQPVAERRMFIW
jgi:hypothetical protein